MIQALAFSLMIGAVTPAQSTAATLATKLAQAIASERGGNATVFVGSLPPRETISAPLPKYTLLGSVVESPRLEAQALGIPGAMTALLDGTQATSLYYELPAGSQDAQGAYEKTLTASGWHQAQFFQDFASRLQQRGGFQATPEPSSQTQMFCGTTGMLSVARPPSMQVLVVTVTTGKLNSMACAMGSALEGMPTPPPAPPLPSLHAANGIQIEPSNAIAGIFASRSVATITSTSPLATIGASFAEQIAAASWTADQPAQSPTAYVQTFRMTSQGRHYQAVLILISLGTSQRYDARLTMRDLDAPASGALPFPL